MRSNCSAAVCPFPAGECERGRGGTKPFIGNLDLCKDYGPIHVFSRLKLGAV